MTRLQSRTDTETRRHGHGDTDTDMDMDMDMDTDTPLPYLRRALMQRLTPDPIDSRAFPFFTSRWQPGSGCYIRYVA